MTTLHHEGVLLAVASNKFQEGTEHLIKEFFPEISFVAILGSRPNFPLKPSPEIVGEILKKSGIQREEAVMVGDSETDMETAINGGIDGIAVGWGYRNMKGFEVPEPVEGPIVYQQRFKVVVSTEELLKTLLP